MHTNLLANLKKLQKGTSGNSSRRKVGSKNMATVVCALLDEEIVAHFPLDDNLRELTADKEME